MTLTGMNFGKDPTAIAVAFSWPGETITVLSPQVTAVTPQSITLIAPLSAILQTVAVGITVSVNGELSNTLTVQPKGTPANVVATSGTPQNTPIDEDFPTDLVATVTDTWGNSLSGVTVAFTVPASGASATLTNNTDTTKANGQATTKTVTANLTAGSYTVTATVPGVSAPANFALTNTPS
jgi:adhesin/invasin